MDAPDISVLASEGFFFSTCSHLLIIGMEGTVHVCESSVPDCLCLGQYLNKGGEKRLKHGRV